MYRGGAGYVYHADGLGSIVGLTDVNGNVAASYTYDSFGNLTASTGTVTNPFRYTAREFDTETGMYYYRARYYLQGVGRFASEDPLGTWDKTAYAYVRANPVNFTDPLGLIRRRPRGAELPPLPPNTVFYLCCRKGKFTVCSVPQNAPTNVMIANCENVHERQHVTDMTANGCNPCQGRPDGPLGVGLAEKSRLECNAYWSQARVCRAMMDRLGSVTTAVSSVQRFRLKWKL